ncbi:MULTISPECIES: hypothetical protein [Kitasatospora]|uniref:Uncharacterized protein n=1 Tax=Kitasatospora setae (strain ATCC 33774 / DSM 43861 / JCM 3304 / KCC A-0304 / NBRC 14216 / KM-6054) TaxID=452652 RepID=E4N4F8_KITSK|nr:MULTISPECIES: hypothetical protein [Kitasatospora]BAJ26089.1 hypothetical protein KSE_02380 [Kitasatospora setae KM-6054]
MRTLSRLAVTAVLAAGSLGLGLGSASAAPGTVSCSGQQTQTFTPGLTLTTRQIAFAADATLGTCASTHGDGITSGAFHIEGGGPGSCTAASFYSELTLTWNTGETSRIGLNTPADLKPLGQTVATSYGQVLSGKYTGGTVVEVLELTPDSLALTKCLTPEGLRDSSGTLSLTIQNLT